MKSNVLIKPNNVLVSVDSGTKIIDAIRDYGQISSVCGGNGTCGKCVVMAKGNLSPKIEKEKSLEEDYRFACTTKILGDATIFVPKNLSQKILTNVTDFEVKCEFNDGFGVAFDIGTTTLVAYLVDLKTGEIKEVVSGLNPQIFYGEDVISRIDYVNKNGIKSLQNPLIKAINDLIDTFNVDIKKATFVGNSCMNHIFLGIDPKSLGEAPYKPAFYDSKIIPGRNLGVNINGDCYFLGNIDGFVGGDTVALILSTIKEKDCLCVDVGTNGEIVLFHNGELYVTSTAAGPAFEGGSIECGMRACMGAIDKVYIENNEIKYHVIDNGEPLGICGSGLVDLLDCLLKMNIVNRSGKMKDRFYLSHKVYISPKDVRNLQLGKGAISSGIKTLLDYVKVSKIDTLYLSGGFGNYLDIKSSVHIGLLPKVENIVPVGNGAGKGAIMCLLNSDYWKKGNEIIKKAHHIDLAHAKEYKENLIDAIMFSGNL